MLRSIAALILAAAAPASSETAQVRGQSTFTEGERRLACGSADRIMLIPTPLPAQFSKQWPTIGRERGALELKPNQELTPPPGARSVGCGAPGQWAFAGVLPGRYYLLAVLVDGQMRHVLWKRIDVAAGQDLAVELSATVYVIG